MKDTQKKVLLTELSAKESATVNGGGGCPRVSTYPPRRTYSSYRPRPTYH